jgi:hypothetical protein
MTRVWITEKGDKYHSKKDCRDLKAGQKSGEGRYNQYPITPTELATAEAAGKGPCGTCTGTTS